MHTSTLHRIEHQQQEARADELERLAVALHCTLAEFFAVIPPEPRNDNVESGR